MAIHSLILDSFRNHTQREFSFSRGLTVIWGENGSGKTAILEAIHTLSFGKSFRTHKQKELIRNGDESMVARGQFSIGTQEDVIAAQVTKSAGQKFKLNGKILTGRKELIGRNNVVVLSPEEQLVTKGGPIERRQFFDKMFSVSSMEYVEILQKYSRILKQRNAALVAVKENRAPLEELKSWDNQLVVAGSKLWNLRLGFITEFKQNLISMSNRYDPNIQFELFYLETIPTEEDYKNKIKISLKKDIALGRTSVGPHRDDVSLRWDNRDLRSFGSQGEHKLSLVLLKLAEMSFIREKTGIHPTLLLDDLFAKLDLERSKKIVSLLQGLESESGDPVQTIVTTTDILNVENSGLLSGVKESKTYHLER
jgi:DNA replication and repair protein RecF